MALKTGRTELSEGTGRTRAAQTADAGKLKERKKKRTNLWRRETVHLQSLLGKLLHRGSACHKLSPDGWNKCFTGGILYTMLTLN